MTFCDCICSFIALQCYLKDWKKFFCIVCGGWTRRTWIVPDLRHWTHKKKPGCRFYHFVCVVMACRVLYRKIAVVKRQEYGITLNLHSSVQVKWFHTSFMKWHRTKSLLVFEVWFKVTLVFITIFTIAFIIDL